MPTVASVIDIIRSRIANGDYGVRNFPAIRKLSEELNVSRQTVRKAVETLAAEGTLHYTPTGRVQFAGGRVAVRQLALLAPAYPSPILFSLYDALQAVADACAWKVKTYHYTHWHDPMIPDVLHNVDGTVFIPFARDIPAEVVRMLTSVPKLVVAGRNLSSHGLPSLQIFPPRFVNQLLDAAGCAQGGGTVACLSTQPMDVQIQERIDYWAQWSALHGVAGPLLNNPVEPTFSAADHARTFLGELLARNDARLNGVGTFFCTTSATALGAMRAMADQGKKPGVDYKICSADSAFGESRLFIPSLTCLNAPSLEPFVRLILDWMSEPERPWPGALLVEPGSPSVFLGESTAP